MRVARGDLAGALCALVTLVSSPGCQVRVGEAPVRQPMGAVCGSAMECAAGGKCRGGLCSWAGPCTVTSTWTTPAGVARTEVTRYRFDELDRPVGFERKTADGKVLVHEDSWAFDGKAVITKVVLDGVQQEMIRSDRDDLGRLQWEAPIFLADEATIPRTEWKWGEVHCQTPSELRQLLDGVVSWSVKATCDERGRPSKRSFHDATGALLHEEQLTYDASGRLTEGARYSEDLQLVERTQRAFRDGALVDETSTYDYSCWSVQAGKARYTP